MLNPVSEATKNNHFLLRIFILGVFAATAQASTIASVADPTTNWNAIPVVDLDPANDQQTGQGDADIVGILADPGFYSASDGTNIYYRVRLGSATNGGFAGLFWIGVDANADGALDLFIGVNDQGSTSTVGFYAPGTGLNNSPSTTTIAKAVPQYQIAQTTSNFNYQTVNAAIDPTITNSDLNGDGKTDAFLSVRIPFLGPSGSATLQGALFALAGIPINGLSTFAYVIATSTQSNSLNQDFGGVPKNFNPASTYTQLGAISPQLNADGTSPASGVPEPATFALFGIALVLMLPTIAVRVRRSRNALLLDAGAGERRGR